MASYSYPNGRKRLLKPGKGGRIKKKSANNELVTAYLRKNVYEKNVQESTAMGVILDSQ